MIILGPETAILGPHFWWSGGRAPTAPLDPPLEYEKFRFGKNSQLLFAMVANNTIKNIRSEIPRKR